MNNIREHFMDYGDLYLVVLVPLLILIFLIWGLLVGSHKLEERSCRLTSEQMQFNYSYEPWTTGCMIEVEENKYIPLSQYYYKESE